jgi:3'-phosphoadenosine 5'-phosphosulfate sulfotransferase (PAPS reductase)/FAD synthetase
MKYFRLGEYENVPNKYGVPKALIYQRSPDFNLHISDACCYKLKKDPIKAWEKQSGRFIGILGLRAAERGQRANKTNCVAFDGDKLHHFSPLLPMDDAWCEWFIQEKKIELPIVYYPPYNLKRTGCKGCPYNTNLQSDLETLERFFPAEAKQCEQIWKPVYEEYRRIGYRLNVYKCKVGQYEFQFGD